MYKYLLGLAFCVTISIVSYRVGKLGAFFERKQDKTWEECKLAESKAIEGCELVAFQMHFELTKCERRNTYYTEQLNQRKEELGEKEQ